MNILEKIVAHKKKEVAQAKARVSAVELERSEHFERRGLSLKKSLLHAENVGIIAEFKRQSPSKGIINATALPQIVTQGYADAGAAGISVLTDAEFFGGSFEDFAKARAACPTTPLLRKDFMVDFYQLLEAKAMGADVILLIAACLTPRQINDLAQQAHALGLEVLLEVHNRQELEQSLCEHIDLVGVNNRNLKNFSTSVETSIELAELIPSDFVMISESSLKDADTIRLLQKIGYRGFLIGETFMKTSDPAAALQQLMNELSQVSIIH
ncbi:MAG: indole-3-glycerol phosphate synthase TrpC [Runella sp.]